MRTILKVLALIASMILLAIAWYYASEKTPPLVNCEDQTERLGECATQLKECRDSLKNVENELLKNRVNDALKVRRQGVR